jgi:hypothetical protein
MRRKQGFAVEWAKVVSRSHREAGAAFKWRIPVLISSQTHATIPVRVTANNRPDPRAPRHYG